MRLSGLLFASVFVLILAFVLCIACGDDDDDDDNNDEVANDDDSDQDESFGACCVNEQCSVATYNDCDGQWLGPDTACDPPDICENQDDYGACCAYSECTVTTYSDCPSAWQGASTTCYPDPCDSGDDDDDSTPSDDDDDTTPMDDDDDDTPPGDDDDDDNESVWLDISSGLMWQNSTDELSPEWTNWDSAVNYCNTLSWAGFNDWRLPSISEVRSLIRGCSATQLGGGCGVTDSCLNFSECWNDSCEGCEWGGGQNGGLYIPQQLNFVGGSLWTSSIRADSADRRVQVWLFEAKITSNSNYSDGVAICVRRNMND